MTETQTRRRGRGRPQKYPWETLLDGADKLVSSGQLRRWGVEAKQFRNAMLTEARRRDITIQTELVGGIAVGVRFPSGSLQPSSRVDWTRYFDGQQRVWPAAEVPFGLPSTEWLDRLKTEAARAGLTPHALLNRETGDCAFSVDVAEPVTRPEPVAEPEDPAAGWVPDEVDEDGVPLRVVLGAPAAGSVE